MLEILSGLFSSVFAGGATGIIGVVAQRYADYKNKQLDLQLLDKKNSHEIDMRNADAAIMAQEWAARTRVADIAAGQAKVVAKTEADAAVDVADAEAFEKSFTLEPLKYSEGVTYTKNQGWLMVIADAVKGIVRPGLTVYLCAITTSIYLDAKALMALKEVSSTQAYDLVMLITRTVLYLTVTCVLWWFGTRNKGKQPS